MTFVCGPAASDAEVAECFEIMRQLRPGLDRADWLPRVRRMQREGYRLATARDADGVAAVAGYRMYDSIVRGGLSCYVDDLVTDERRRSRGAGHALLDWLVSEARRQRCTQLCLDSGVQRPDAHRFYFRERMGITAFHFVLALEQSP